MNAIADYIAADRARRFAASDQLSLGEIISKCETIAARNHRLHDGSEPTVQFAFEHAHPTTIGSWRGSYDELALSFAFDGEAPPLSDFLRTLRGAVGATFTGYKGGAFTMSSHTPVWVANYGNSGNTAVVDVVDGKHFVLIATAYREY